MAGPAVSSEDYHLQFQWQITSVNLNTITQLLQHHIHKQASVEHMLHCEFYAGLSMGERTAASEAGQHGMWSNNTVITCTTWLVFYYMSICNDDHANYVVPGVT